MKTTRRRYSADFKAAEFLAQLREDKAMLTSGKGVALRPLASVEAKALDLALDEVRTSIDRRIAAQLAKAPVTPIPYRTSADLQIDATLLAAKALERG